jgi:hypothetical protein
MAVSIRDDYPPGTRGGNTCSCCHSGQRDIRDPKTNELRKELVVDLGETVDFEGFIMVCEQCVREAARMLGMIEPTERDAALADLHEVQRAADEALADRDEARALVESLRAYDEKQPAVTVPAEAATVDEAVKKLPAKRPNARVIK